MSNKTTAELSKYARKMAAYYHKSAKHSYRTNIVAYERTKRHADYNQQTADRLAEQQKVIDGLKAEKENHSALCYAVAVSTLWGLGCQSEAADLAGELSVTLDSVKDVGLSEYDLDNLSELYKAFPWVNQKALQPKAVNNG